MKEFEVKILDSAFADIDVIADFIVSVSTPEHAVRYTRELGDEILNLRYLAGIIPESNYFSAHQYHPHAKLLSVMNRQLVVIFHEENDTAVVNKILPSKMIVG